MGAWSCAKSFVTSMWNGAAWLCSSMRRDGTLNTEVAAVAATPLLRARDAREIISDPSATPSAPTCACYQFTLGRTMEAWQRNKNVMDDPLARIDVLINTDVQIGGWCPKC